AKLQQRQVQGLYNQFARHDKTQGQGRFLLAMGATVLLASTRLLGMDRTEWAMSGLVLTLVVWLLGWRKIAR
ncbi:MAG: ubiquinone biosynthesis regulatory protein kinase UbiB, partial [Oceanisphaera sp.]|nr:ubiquinone biosynthesis regulatory protein kinase UbiB [Oceanisphaera sp.]